MGQTTVQRFADRALRASSALAFLAPLLTRLAIGSAYHFTGDGKLHHLDRTTQFFASLSIPFPHFNAIFIAWLEFVGGLGLFFGLATRIFAALLSCSMIVALITSDGGEWLKKFPADITDVTSFTYLLFLIWLVLYGPGPVSIDNLLAKWLHIGGPRPPRARTRIKSMANRWDYKDLGFGIGLRSVHFQHILDKNPAIDWFEVLSENYMDTGGRPLHVLDQVAERYPLVLHGVSLSVGSTDPINFEYLKKLKALAQRVKANWVSDHLCWCGVTGLNTHDLLPMPYTTEALRHTVARVRTIQDFLERPIALENASTYLEFAASTWPESEFLAALAEEADCGILLDVNNVYVSSYNHGFDPKAYIDRIPRDRVVQMHLAGHTNKGTHIVDTHNDYVIDTVWDLYRYAHRRLGGVATLLEWDANIPSFEVVHSEALKARKFREQEEAQLKTPELAEIPAYGD